MLIAGALLAGLASAAQAQPTGYYPNRSADYAYRYEPPKAYGYDGSYTPYSYGDGYDGYNGDATLLRGGLSADILNSAPYDRFGPNPDGMTGAEGKPIRCKLVNRYDADQGRDVTRRECW
jgi:hypothetical protein